MNKSDNPIPRTLLFSLSLFGQIGFGVAIPLVGLGLLGRYLDKKFDTGYTLFLIGIGLAVVITFFYLKKIIKEAIERAKKL
jgi:membrane protease YdiL (CAAX protease family)